MGQIGLRMMLKYPRSPLWNNKTAAVDLV